MAVYDVMSREVARLAESAYAAGRYEVCFGGSHLSGESYLILMTAGAFSQT